MKKELGGKCNLFWDKDSKEKEQGIITESPIKNYEVILLWKKRKKKIGFLIFRNIISQQWGYGQEEGERGSVESPWGVMRQRVDSM